MALIKIRGRLEPIAMDDARAKKIKERKFGVEGRVEKALPTELVDLGDWSGEYGRIVEIELSKKTDDNDPRELEKKRAHEERVKFLAQSPKAKANIVGWFKVMYASRMGDWKAEPSAETLAKVVELQERLYTADKNLMPMRITAAEYGDLLPPRRGGSMRLGDRMRIKHEEEVTYPT